MLLAIKRKALLPSNNTMEYQQQHLIKLAILFSLTILCCKCELPKNHNTTNLLKNMPYMTMTTTPTRREEPILNKHNIDSKSPNNAEQKYDSDMLEFESIMAAYVKDVLERKKINLMPGVYIEKVVATNHSSDLNSRADESKSFEENFLWTVKKFTNTHALRVDMSRAFAGTGRIFLFKGK